MSQAPREEKRASSPGSPKDWYRPCGGCVCGEPVAVSEERWIWPGGQGGTLLRTSAYQLGVLGMPGCKMGTILLLSSGWLGGLRADARDGMPRTVPVQGGSEEAAGP